MKTFILIAALAGLASCAPKVNLKDEVPIQDCGKFNLNNKVKKYIHMNVSGSKVEIMSIDFDGCTGFPCIVHQGTTATGKLTMKANAATETLTCKVGD